MGTEGGELDLGVLAFSADAGVQGDVHRRLTSIRRSTARAGAFDRPTTGRAPLHEV